MSTNDSNSQALEVKTTSPDNWIELAVKQNFDIDKLSKLLEMKTLWDKELARKEFFRNMTLFQSEVPEITKNRDAYNSKYAELSHIDKVIKPFKLKYGFSSRWEITETKDAKGEKEYEVTCIVTHEQGHSERTTMKGPADETGSKNKIQAGGSSFSYLQRYTMVGAFGLTTAFADNDGGKKLPPEIKKVKLTPQQYSNALEAVKTGKKKLQSVLDNCILSEDQIKELTQMDFNRLDDKNQKK